MHGMMRLYCDLIQKYCSYFPIVALIGVRQCGKTTLLKTLDEEWKLFDLEKISDYNYISLDPDLFLRLNSNKIAIDEAQLLPSLFSALRIAVDNDRNKYGRYIITGSSSPELIKSISETLAGRIGIIEVSPLLLTETIINPPANLYSLINDPALIKDALLFKQTADLEMIHHYWLRGGYPEPFIRNDNGFYDHWKENYINTYVERDISRLFPSLNRMRFKQFIQTLAYYSGTVINYSDIARSLQVSQPTVREYFKIAHGTFIWREILPYNKNTEKRITKHPKGYLRDSGILHHLLRINNLNQLLIHPKMGLSFESMVIEEIIRNLNARGIIFDYYYYRTSNGGEIDLILEGSFGIIPIEIKYSQHIGKKDIISLKEFVRDHDCPIAIVVNNGEKVVFLDEKIICIPFGFCL